MSRQQLKEKGFTIIEVVLVLAIAALIFLMVFIALPALNRNQRDTARKSDVSLVSSAVNTWSTNNRGAALTTLTDAALAQYVTDKSGNTTTVNVVAFATTITVADGTVSVVPGARCNTVEANGRVNLTAGTARQYATITRLESGNNSGYCLDS